MQPELRKLIQDIILQARAELMRYDRSIKARRKAAIHELRYCCDSFAASVLKVLLAADGIDALDKCLATFPGSQVWYVVMDDESGE